MSKKMLEVFNPATEEKIGEVGLHEPEDLQAALARARHASVVMGSMPIKDRQRIVLRFLEILSAKSDEVAELLSREGGKPINEAYFMEVMSVAYLAYYFGRNAHKILAPKKIKISVMKHKHSEVRYLPRGVVLVISPWNFPMSIPTGEIIMALLAGNAVVHKPASLTPLIALKMRELFLEAGLPEDALQVVPCRGRFAETMIGPQIDYMNFTGSVDIGVRLAQVCAKHMIPATFELGGKDPGLVFADADLERAANSVVYGAFGNAGQVCASIERLYVERSIYDRFVDMIVERVRGIRVGDPMDPNTDMGPMASAGQLEVVQAQVEDAADNGAGILAGGKRRPGKGYFFEPTVLVDVTDNMLVMKEETFGPVLPILPFDGEEQAISLANHSEFGLTAAIYTGDKARADRLADRVVAGTIMINDSIYTHALPETPWGGVKFSGMGVTHADEGLRHLARKVHVNKPLLAPTRELYWHPYTEKGLKLGKKTVQALAKLGQWIPRW